MPYRSSSREKRALPMLESLRVASPCSMPWDDMIGDDRVRYCGKCHKNVYDLSAMTREEAEDFVRVRRGTVCVTYRRRADGTVITDDCPVGARRRRFRWGALALAAGGAATIVAAPTPEVPREPLGRAHAEPRVHVPKAVEWRAEPTETHAGASYAITGLLAAPVSARAPRTTGCLCEPGDPLCTCL